MLLEIGIIFVAYLGTRVYGLCEEVYNVAKRYQDRCNRSKILPTTKW